MKSQPRLRVASRILLGLVFVGVFLLAAVALYAHKSQWFPRLDDVPQFDASKARSMTAEKRAAYERELFIELSYWNTATRRFPGATGMAAREARWREMAADGFELADVVLRVLDPSSGVVYSLRGPMRRLERLAEAGDAGAMCLMVGLANRAAIAQDWRPYQATYLKWLVVGAQRGHPECLRRRGARLYQGSDGYAKDASSGLRDLVNAARAGYVHAAATLVLHFRETDWQSNVQNARRLFCWTAVEDTVWTGVSLDRYWDGTNKLLRDLVRLHPPGTATQWDNLLRELREAKFASEDCTKLGLGD